MEITRPHALLALAIICAVVSQLLFRSGVSSIGSLTLSRETIVPEVVRVATSLPILAGMLVYSVGFMGWIAALSRFGLSYVYPFTALNYVLILLSSWMLFDEPLSPVRWLGVGVIILGVLIVARS